MHTTAETINKFFKFLQNKNAYTRLLCAVMGAH